MNIAIVVVAYNRLSSLKRVLNSLSNAFINNAPLIISIDKSDNTIVEDFADNFHWKYGDKEVIKHKKNLGLREHMLSLGNLFEKYDTLIILEDDIVVSPNFFNFACAASEYYKNETYIAGISLYNYEFNYQTFAPFTALKNEFDVYFMQIAMSWGQVWMKDSWKQFYKWYLENKEFKLQNLPGEYSFKDWGEKSWLKYHIGYCILNNKYFVYPYNSLTTNFSDKGTHIKNDMYIFQSNLYYGNDTYQYRFPSFTNGIVYDSYNENIAIYNKLGLTKDELCINLSQNFITIKKRYLLTTECLNYKIIKKYSLDYRPIELNVLLDNTDGSGIFLYDTSYHKNNKFNLKSINLISYQYRIHSILALLNKIGLIQLTRLVIKKILRKS